MRPIARSPPPPVKAFRQSLKRPALLLLLRLRLPLGLLLGLKWILSKVREREKVASGARNEE